MSFNVLDGLSMLAFKGFFLVRETKKNRPEPRPDCAEAGGAPGQVVADEESGVVRSVVMVQLPRVFDVSLDMSDAPLQSLKSFHVESIIHSLPLWYKHKTVDTADIKKKMQIL